MQWSLKYYGNFELGATALVPRLRHFPLRAITRPSSPTTLVLSSRHLFYAATFLRRVRLSDGARPAPPSCSFGHRCSARTPRYVLSSDSARSLAPFSSILVSPVRIQDLTHPAPCCNDSTSAFNPNLTFPGPTIGTTSSMPYASLAAHRGKSLSGLELKGLIIEHSEYPDIPTAFCGSSIDRSPRFDTFPVPSFTDHETMLLNLKSKCTTPGSGVSQKRSSTHQAYQWLKMAAQDGGQNGARYACSLLHSLTSHIIFHAQARPRCCCYYFGGIWQVMPRPIWLYRRLPTCGCRSVSCLQWMRPNLNTRLESDWSAR